MVRTMGAASGGNGRYRLFLGVIVALGFGLRVAAAQGALWLDEAWSAVMAHEAATPLAVFLKINHDNNHHLNSLWLQFVGLGAPPVVARALSILTGTAGILVAGLIGRRRAPLLGLITAAMFAISPILVTLGSEARGYAPMALALLVAILLVDRWLAGEAERSPATALALCFLLGMLSQLTMAFGFCAVAGWTFFASWTERSPARAAMASFKLLWPSFAMIVLVVAVIAGAASTSPKGFEFGGWDPFTWMQYLRGLSEMAGYTFGYPDIYVLWFALVPVLVILARRAGVSRLPFHMLAILAFPAAIALLHPVNVAYGRYYLLISIALLILAAELAWLGLAAGGWKRLAAALALGSFAVGSLACDVELIRNQRADPGAAIRALQARAPGGAAVFIERDRGRAVLITAAAAARYPLTVRGTTCPTPRFLFIDRFINESFPAAPRHCDRRYRPIATARVHGMSGTDWTLYEISP